jgi:Fe-S cluster assembly ATPase SufC
VPGVSNVDFLRLATNERRKARGEKELDPLEFYAHVAPKVRGCVGGLGLLRSRLQFIMRAACAAARGWPRVARPPLAHHSPTPTHLTHHPPTQPTQLEALRMDPAFLNRGVNEGFSGGEKKRNEILQLACLEADCAILDEIDSGLDIDALRDVAAAVNGLRAERPAQALLMVTHYKRLLDLIRPDHVHVMRAGRVVKSGGIEIVDALEEGGYEALAAAGAAR